MQAAKGGEKQSIVITSSASPVTRKTRNSEKYNNDTDNSVSNHNYLIGLKALSIGENSGTKN